MKPKKWKLKILGHETVIKQFSPIWWTGWTLIWAAGIAMFWINLCGWAAIPT